MSKIGLTVVLLYALINVQVSESVLQQLMVNAANFFNTLDLRRTVSDVNEAVSGNNLQTNLDNNFRGLFLMARKMSTMYGLDINDSLLRLNRKAGKLQEVLGADKSFPCNVTNTRSPVPPSSIHELRPGDIDVIASIGDSLSAGNGIISEHILQILNENRGITFSGGGQGTWRNYLTLPNILKVFNPKLYGYSTNDSLTIDSDSHLNIAEPMIMSRDLPFQARVLIERMRADPKINMKTHWKLLTIFVGNNDICSDMCHHNNLTQFLKAHERDLRQGLTLLRDNVPRLLVNLLPVPNLASTLHKMHNVPPQCTIVHRLGCHCLFNERVHAEQLRKAARVIDRWQKVDQRVAALPEFNTLDFAVVLQPLTINVTLPTLPNGEFDMRFFASDCFHFSQLGHAAIANTLWNNMLENVGEKEKNFKPAFEKFLCPTPERPYITTMQNSQQRIWTDS